MGAGLKGMVHRAFRALGFDIRAAGRLETYVRECEAERRWRDLAWLRALALVDVIDIGANTGQFARDIRGLLPQVRVHAFEPLPDVHDGLVRTLAQLGNAHAYPYGLGDVDMETMMHRHAYSPASSILTMTARQQAELSHARPEVLSAGGEMPIRVRRLDAVAEEIGVRSPYLVKIDTEGYEDRVIRGGAATLRGAAVVIIETSLYELYAGQALFDTIHALMRELDFVYAGCWSDHRAAQDGLVIQQDSIFLPRGMANQRLAVRAAAPEAVSP